MLILFADKSLEKACNNKSVLVKKYGSNQTVKILTRLADIQAAHNLDIMRSLPGRCHELTGNMKGYLALDLVQPYRLIFEPSNSPIPLKKDGGLDWTKVTEIKIIKIENYHG